jgi:hypothetical protein
VQIKCDVTSQKVELGWLKTLEKRSGYGDGGGWEVIDC